jgi:hypothetical protein
MSLSKFSFEQSISFRIHLYNVIKSSKDISDSLQEVNTDLCVVCLLL